MTNARCVLTLLVILCTAPSYAQQRYNEVIKAAAPVATYLTRWGTGELRWSKRDYTDTFQQSLEQLAQGKPQQWYTDRLKGWNDLPTALRPELPLTPAAELLIMSHFAEQSQQFDVDNQSRVLEAKLYAVLATAQQQALQGRTKQISPSDVFVAFDKFWTGLWPLCPRKPEKAPDRK